VQSWCEVAVLLLIVAAFVVAGSGVRSHRQLQAAAVDAASASAAAVRELRRQIVVTTAVVFVAFVVRSVQSTMFAVARQLQDGAKRCPGVTVRCDPSCHNVFTLIRGGYSTRPSSR
jgi:predicted secreted protein